MAYFYNSSNYSEIPDNYQYYNNHDYSYNYDPRYVQYYNTEFHENAYQHVSTPPLVGYYYSNYSQPESLTSKNALFNENGGYYDEAVSTEYVVSYNTTAETEAKDVVVFEEYNPKPFQGGYDINEQYGKPLSPSEKICYPPSKPMPSGVEDGDEEDDYDDEDDDDYDDDGDDDDEYDDGEGDGGEKAGEKHGDLGKEASEAAVIAALGSGGVEKKQDQNLEGVAKPQNEGIAGEVIQEKKASDFEAAKKEEEEEEDDDDDVGEEGKGEEKKGDLGVNKEPSKTIIPVTSLDDAISDKEAKKIEDEAETKNGSIAGEVIQEQKPPNFERNQEQQQKEGGMSDQVSKVEDHGNQIRRQIPPGYGMESLDLCEGLFGGYFPCLWKRKQGNTISTNANANANANNQQSGYYYENMSDYDYCCKETVDYLFGNPNPYGGSMPEKGSYGDPVYSYQRYYPQQPLTEQVDCYGPRY